MKQYVLILAMAMLALNSAAKTQPPLELEKHLKKMITYPENARQDKMEGWVLVAFEVSPTGEVIIEAMNASNEIFEKYVRERLSEMNLESIESLGKHYMKFHFNFVRK